MEFIHEADRIYANDEKGRLVAEITFPKVNGVPVIDHTFVDDSLRGQGIAGKLVRAALDQLRTEKAPEIRATCSYVQVWAERHPEEGIIPEGPMACQVNGRH